MVRCLSDLGNTLERNKHRMCDTRLLSPLKQIHELTSAKIMTVKYNDNVM